jgi:hypothetical protein
VGLEGDGPHLGLGVQRVAEPNRARPRRKALQELVVDAVLHHQPRAGHAGLSGGREDAGDHAVGGGVEVRVGENDVRRLAAELEAHARKVVGRALHHRAARRRRAGEGDLVDARVRRQRGAGVRAEAGDDVEHPGREARLLDERPELERRGRRLLGGLDDERAARRERGRELPAHQQHRGVPGRDRRHHADRLAHRVDEEVRAVGRDRLTVDLVRGPGEPVVIVGQSAQLALHLADELAVVGGLDDRDPLRVLRDEIRQAAHEPRTLRPGDGVPGTVVEGRARGGDSRGHVLRAGAGDLGPRLPGERVDGLEGLTRKGVDPLAADQHAVPAKRRG